jgi:hypothetical protein
VSTKLGQLHTRLLEAARSVGVGVGTKLQIKVGDLVDAFRNGGPPGFRFAYAGGGGGLPPSFANAPPEAIAWITVRPLQDLNAPRPMMQEHGRGRDLIEIGDVDPRTGSLFDPRDPDASVQDDNFGPQLDENASEFDDGYKIKSPREAPARDPRRPSWQDSEAEVSNSLDWAGFSDQQSFAYGQEVPRGVSGSTRPDSYGEDFNLSVEVKNYKLGTKADQRKLIRDVIEQITDRASHLPKGVRQGVVIDARGQLISPSKLLSLRTQIAEASRGLLATDDIVFLSE